MGFFPYAPRPYQDAARELVRSSLSTGGHVVVEMPTGSGKTVVLLSAALEAAQASGRRVLYVTRTNSHQEQAVREFNAIRSASGLPLVAVALQGRSRLCSKLEDSKDPDWTEATSEELGHFCSAAKARTEKSRSDPAACKYFAGLLDLDPDRLASFYGPECLTAEAWKERAAAAGLCAYEANKRLLPSADLVIAPYVYAVDGSLRRRLLDWWGVPEDRVLLVVDEAHNLPDYLRQEYSPKVRAEGLTRALEEARQLGNPEVLRGVAATRLLEALQGALERVTQEYCKDEDGFVPPFEVETILLERFSATTTHLRQASGILVQLGEMVRDRLRLLGKVPRSHIMRVGRFLQSWLASDEEGYVKLVGVDPKPYLEAYLVDTARLSELFTRTAGTVHASGTLTPLEEYRDALGLPEATRLERVPSPFDPRRLVVRAVAGLTTRYEDLQKDPQAVDRIQDAARQAIAAARVSAAVFFPSHRLLQEFVEVGVFDGVTDALVETRDLDQAGLMRMIARHRSRPGSSLLAGVLGGRLSEGLDFPGRQLELAVVVGVPYPKPTAHQRALFHYYEVRMGRGWEYSVRAPALRRLRQAIGRLVRSPEDRGFAIILDERAGPLLRAAGVEAESSPLGEVLAELATWQKVETPSAPVRPTP